MFTSAGRNVRRFNFVRCARPGSSCKSDLNFSQADLGWMKGKYIWANCVRPIVKHWFCCIMVLFRKLICIIRIILSTNSYLMMQRYEKSARYARKSANILV